MRHAKSDWSTRAADDHGRPLAKRGRRDAPRVGERLAALGWRPELVLSSDAARTRETWQRMADAFEPRAEVRFLPSFYLGGLGAVADALATVGDGLTTVLVLGHNPGWETMASRLTGDDLTLTTANAACLSVEAASWAEAVQLEGIWRLEQLVRPREL